MPRGPLPLNAHAALEPVMAVLIVAAPWLFGFSDVSDATTVCVVIGAVMLLAGGMTRWRYSLVKLIPLPVHFAMDLLLGVLLILSPFILDFSDEGGAARFTIIAGALEIVTALGTRWQPDEAAERHPRNTSGVRPAR